MSSSGKFKEFFAYSHLNLEREVKVIKFRGDPSRMSGIIEVRGIVNKDGTLSYGEFTQYDNEFGKSLKSP